MQFHSFQSHTSAQQLTLEPVEADGENTFGRSGGRASRHGGAGSWWSKAQGLWMFTLVGLSWGAGGAWAMGPAGPLGPPILNAVAASWLWSDSASVTQESRPGAHGNPAPDRPPEPPPGATPGDRSPGAASTEAPNLAGERFLPTAHSHNDYHRKRPLQDALERGFASVEADVFLREGELYVAHWQLEIRPGRTLETLYLAPLRQRCRELAGRVHPGGQPLWLLIDLKDRGEETYQAVDGLLAKYADIVACTSEGQTTEKPVRVVISGACPAETIRRQAVRHAGIDGRLGDLDRDDPATLMPWISADWKSEFKWRGVGEFPASERARLRELVERCHARGRLLRFWGAPDREEIWTALREAGVDLLGTDDLDRLARFLRGPAAPIGSQAPGQ
ncbi:MAG: phosphatidylinositol-specific phospholipase C/glycerophosphodiester phosphodiesterase family protein [Planctomycetaceae bacterium]